MVWLLICLPLSACKEPAEPPPLPEGIQTIEGMLIPAELSIKRSGTHLLQQNGNSLYYIESKSINLKPFEYEFITAKGTVKNNIDPAALPVLVLNEITRPEEALTGWELKDSNISGQTSAEWVQKGTGSQLEFFYQNSKKPIASIVSQAKKDISFDDFVSQLPAGNFTTISRHEAYEIKNDQTGQQVIYINHNDLIVEIVFAPSDKEEHDRWEPVFRHMLKSIVLDSSNKTYKSNPRFTDTTTTSDGVPLDGNPCGGPAGVLCPSGQLCIIDDKNLGIGHCRLMK